MPHRSSSRHVHDSQAHENQLLAALPPDLLNRLRPHLEGIVLTKGEMLYEIGEPVDFILFPTSGLVSLAGSTTEGGSVEIFNVTNDALLGLPVCVASQGAPTSAQVLVSGRACRLRTAVFLAEYQHSQPLQGLLLEWAHRLLCETAQAIVCHRFHRLLERLCRWLLTATDRLHTDRLALTQEELGNALGVPRTAVTLAAVALQDAGAISCRHGRLAILNRRRLELSACECYEVNRTKASQVRFPLEVH